MILFVKQLFQLTSFYLCKPCKLKENSKTNDKHQIAYQSDWHILDAPDAPVSL